MMVLPALFAAVLIVAAAIKVTSNHAKSPARYLRWTLPFLFLAASALVDETWQRVALATIGLGVLGLVVAGFPRAEPHNTHIA